MDYAHPLIKAFTKGLGSIFWLQSEIYADLIWKIMLFTITWILFLKLDVCLEYLRILLASLLRVLIYI